MRIVKEDQNVLILKDRNFIAFIAGAIFLLAGIVVILGNDFFENRPPFWSGFAGIILGVFVIMVSRITIIEMDKSKSKLAILRKGLIGRSYNEYDLKQIKEVELNVAYHPQSEGNNRPSYSLAFILSSGNAVQFNPGNSVRIMGRQIISEKALGERTAAFLGVPFRERRPPTVNEILSAVTSATRDVIKKETEKQ